MPKKQGSAGLRGAPIPSGDELGAAELAGRVAENFRAQRKRRAMSLDELAQLTGVSRAALSQSKRARPIRPSAYCGKSPRGSGSRLPI